MTNRKPGRPARRKPATPTFGGARLKTQLTPEQVRKFRGKGFHLAWLLEDQIPEALESGYSHVTKSELGGSPGEAELHDNNTDLGSLVSMRGNRPMDGNAAQNIYLMKVDQDKFEADQEVRRQPAIDAEAAINRGTLGGAIDHGYVKQNHGIRR